MGRAGLWILSLPYAALFSLWGAGRKPGRVGAPVISVGNLTMGGTGKTSLTAALSRVLLKKGLSVAVLTRGYKGGDEPQMLKKQFKNSLAFHILTGSDRFDCAKSFLSRAPSGPVVFLLDDGHQHRTLHKDVSLVILDALDAEGLRGLIPYGFLREPLAQGLSRADAVVISHVDLVPAPALSDLEALVRRHGRGIPIAHGSHRPLGFERLNQEGNSLPPEAFRGRPVGLVSAIGNPASFEITLRRLGAHILWHEALDDHAPFSHSRLEGILQRAQRDRAYAIITTAKDAVRLGNFWGSPPGENGRIQVPWYTLEIEFVFLKGENEIWAVIERTLNKYAAA